MTKSDLAAIVSNLAIIINWSFSWYDHPSQMCQNLKIRSLSIVNFNAWNYICPYLIVKDHKMLNTKVWILEIVWFTDVSFFKEGQHRQNPDDCKPDPYGKYYNLKLIWINNLHFFLSTSFQQNIIVKVAGAVMWIQTVYTMGFPKGFQWNAWSGDNTNLVPNSYLNFEWTWYQEICRYPFNKLLKNCAVFIKIHAGPCG